ncbi:unnamed protein product [Penicillium egyptiacum]|uniref:Glutamine amidotransferase domain-containing protein n=1 Tax=Penicillium egyptiacum TaxID=1303716 RepID=A0A9W4K9K7_9EURO|nr:unnamed protein product [Penicillium egyptiacum]
MNASGVKEAPSATVRVSAWDIHGGSYPPYDILRQKPPDRLERCLTPLSTDSGSHALGPVDAILITGAAPGVYEIERHAWMQNLEVYIRVVFQNYRHVQILGSCFGHQIIAKTILPDFGSTYQVGVEKCPLGREVGIYEVQMNHAFTRTFPVLNKLPEGKLRVQMMHADWVSVTRRDSDKRSMSLPHPWQNIGSTAICPIQGLYYPGRVFTVQGHFETGCFCDDQSM